MRRSCGVCGKFVNVNTLKRLYPNSVVPKFILTIALWLIGVLDAISIERVVEKLSKSMAYICHDHVVHAAQYLCAEMAAVGKRISYCEESCGRRAYITTTDVPLHLVEVFNERCKGRVVITARDLWVFINDTLKKYHGTEMWPEKYVEEEGLEEEGTTVGAEHAGGVDESRTAVSSPMGSADVAEDAEMVEDYSQSDDEGSSGTEQVSEYVPSESDSDSSSVETSRFLGQTEEADLQKYYLVKGEKLMKLFRFCPECGYELGSTQLKPVGTAAVVRFVCGRCSSRKPPVKRWESQDRLVPHSRERKFKGNVVAAVAAITTGLRFFQFPNG